MIRKNKESFWSRPDGFAVVDALSLLFSLTYLFVSISSIYISNADKLISIQANMNIPLSIILTGYFGDQVSNRIKTAIENKNKNGGE